MDGAKETVGHRQLMRSQAICAPVLATSRKNDVPTFIKEREQQGLHVVGLCCELPAW